LNKDQYRHLSESDLLSYYRNTGDSEWLGLLFERYTVLLLGVCMKYLKNEEEAKDAVQQVFVKALGEIPKYTIDNIGGWLYQVSRNYCFTLLRSQKQHLTEQYMYGVSEEEREPESELWQKENDIDKLKESVCIVLFYLEKKSYNEIVALTGQNINQVKSNIQNGKRNLRIKMMS
jgi:RNA polymerase sigma factor (sigma-70 family)